MIRFLLAEQLYRSFTIIKGKKYHYWSTGLFKWK
jgi:23S rRNA pseudoU1915 N3-methylase RlmH